MNKRQKKELITISASAVLLLAFNMIPSSGVLRLVLFMIPYLAVGYPVIRKAVSGLLHGRVMDENFLMTLATFGAIGLAIYTGSGDYNEAVFVMLFYQTGELFQSFAAEKSRKSIKALTKIRPEYATVEKNGRLESVRAEDVEIGDVTVVRAGERAPVDGVVIEGEALVDLSALTGESVPVTVKSGGEVKSGAVVLASPIRLKALRRFEDSAASRILKLVCEASEKKSRYERFITRFSAVYTPAVCIAAVFISLGVPLISFLLGYGFDAAPWIYRGLTFLVISCPCALVISIPLTFFAGLGAASRAGILVKGSNYMERLAKTDRAAFDKTGTLTLGRFSVTEYSSKEALSVAAAVERLSSHPIARAIAEACGDIEADIKNVRELSGMGVTAELDGDTVAVGNDRLMELLGADHERREGAVYVSRGGRYLGYIKVEDKVKEDAADAIRKMKALGVKKTLILTGDGERVALEVSRKVGADGYIAELLPEEKLRHLEAFMSGAHTTVYVGDGINDSPVLMRADVGVSMGAIGSDAAIEASDAVIIDDDIKKLPLMLEISKKTVRIARQNTVLSIGVKAVCLILTLIGIADMGLGVFADVGVMALAVLNAARAMRLPK